MMNKLKYLFLLVLCAAMIGGAVNISAQTSDKILVSAKGKTLRQSDVNTLIEFYEWAFQAEFNSTQRADFQEYTESGFRANPAGSRETIDDIVKTLPAETETFKINFENYFDDKQLCLTSSDKMCFSPAK